MPVSASHSSRSGEAPKGGGVRTYKSRIAEEREYARLLSAAISSERPASGHTLKSAVWRQPDQKQRPQTSGGGVRSGQSGASAKLRPVPTSSAETTGLTRSSTETESRRDPEVTQQMARERDLERRAAKATASTAALTDELKRQERRAEWSQKQLAHCAQQLAQMRALLVTVSEQRDSAYDAAEIAAEEAQVAAEEASRLRGENHRLRTEIAELTHSALSCGVQTIDCVWPLTTYPDEAAASLIG